MFIYTDSKFSEEYLKNIYALLIIHTYKHYLSKQSLPIITKPWGLLHKYNYGHKLDYWKTLLENNKHIWDYTKVPANIPLKELITNKDRIQSNSFELTQIYLPENLLTLDNTFIFGFLFTDYVKQIATTIPNFYNIKVEFTYNDSYSKPGILNLHVLTNKSTVNYSIKSNNCNYYFSVYLNNKTIPFLIKDSKLIISLESNINADNNR